MPATPSHQPSASSLPGGGAHATIGRDPAHDADHGRFLRAEQPPRDPARGDLPPHAHGEPVGKGERALDEDGPSGPRAHRPAPLLCHVPPSRQGSVAVLPQGLRKTRGPGRFRGRAGRFLAPCFTWRQYASNHHGAFSCGCDITPDAGGTSRPGAGLLRFRLPRPRLAPPPAPTDFSNDVRSTPPVRASVEPVRGSMEPHHPHYDHPHRPPISGAGRRSTSWTLTRSRTRTLGAAGPRLGPASFFPVRARAP